MAFPEEITIQMGFAPSKHRKRIYICGKVTGLPYEMVDEKFNVAAFSLVAKGHEVVNPVKLVGDTTMDWKQAMRMCIAELMQCDAIYMLPCWPKSKGSILERYIAGCVGIEIIEAEKQ